MRIELDKNLRVMSSKSNHSLIIDGTKDFGGLGESFSPTDLLCNSLASCILIMIAKKAGDMGYEIAGSNADFRYSYKEGPKISSITLNIVLKNISEDILDILRAEGEKCPIHKALSSDIKFKLNLSTKL